MYPDLYKGLRLKPEDLASYDSPFVGFDGKNFVPKVWLNYLFRWAPE